MIFSRAPIKCLSLCFVELSSAGLLHSVMAMHAHQLVQVCSSLFASMLTSKHIFLFVQLSPLSASALSRTVTSPCGGWKHQYRSTSTKVTLHYKSPITNNKVDEGEACTTHLIGIAAPAPSAEAATEDWSFDVVSVKSTNIRVSTHTSGQSQVATAVSDAAAERNAQKSGLESSSADPN